MSSAPKIELIVDKVKSLAQRRFSPESLPSGWFRHMVNPCAPVERDGVEAIQDADQSSAVIGSVDQARPPPFLPFTTLLITGTAGAGKTSSIQVLAANLNCVITGTTVISAQALSSVLNRTRMAQVKTIYRAFGFNSKHVAIADRSYARRPEVPFVDKTPIEEQQWRDLGAYWPVIADIANKVLSTERRSRDVPEFCESNIIVIDECGVILRHMLHVVVFFYYFYNAVNETSLYRQGCVPCIVCVGSPTQTEALETRYDRRSESRNVQRGMDVLSALISDDVLSEYCRVTDNWIMFINNKRCLDLEFGNVLKHIEFGLPLKTEHVEYLDRFVRPPNFIRDPSHALGMTRLFISHAEVQRYFRTLHDQLRVSNRHLLFDMPVYCVLNNKNFEEYCGCIGNGSPRPEVWFKNNLSRITNYSQFIDHNMSEHVEMEELTGENCEDTEAPADETLLVSKITYIRDSTVGVTAKMRSCVVGFSGTFEEFSEILQKDIFIERTPCEQAVYAYSLISGLLFSAMYVFYTSPFSTVDVLHDLGRIPLPHIEALCQKEGEGGGLGSTTVVGGDRGASGEADECSDRELAEAADAAENADDGLCHDIPCLRERVVGGSPPALLEHEISDVELFCSTDIYADKFFLKYASPPPVSCMTFEDAVHIYTAFRDIFLARFRVLQKHSQGRFGRSKLVTYNRRNVWRRKTCEIVSQTGSFVGMLTYASPVNSYIVEGFTNDEVLTMSGDRAKIHRRILERGLPRLVVRDPHGFIAILDYNFSKFSDVVEDKSLHICTTIDYGVNSRMAMTIAKSQGLSLESVAIDFGDNPKNLKMSQIYVAISRVVDPDRLIMSLNPMRISYEKNTFITPYIRRALQNKKTTLIF